MRNIHAKLISEYGQESVRFLRQWETLEMKMVDFQNHRRFTLRCLSKDLIPVSIKLKTTVKTPKGIYIVSKEGNQQHNHHNWCRFLILLVES